MSEQLYRLCPRCGGSGQVRSDKADQLQFASLPCPDCRQVWVVPIVADSPYAGGGSKFLTFSLDKGSGVGKK